MLEAFGHLVGILKEYDATTVNFCSSQVTEGDNRGICKIATVVGPHVRTKSSGPIKKLKGQQQSVVSSGTTEIE